MDPQIVSRIFEPFFTTKEHGKGTGLGLSTVAGIVGQSDGFIGVETAPGCGTTFSIYFPAVRELTTPSKQSIAAVRGGNETILLAEDDPQLRPLAQAMLKRLGYHVLPAGNAADALAIARQYAHPIDLLLTDVVMPGSSGRDLALALTGSRPQTRVLYMSGYTQDAILQHGVLEGGVTLIHKPFSLSELARRVREILDPGQPVRH